MCVCVRALAYFFCTHVPLSLLCCYSMRLSNTKGFAWDFFFVHFTRRYLRDEWRFSEDLAKYIVFAIANVDARCPAREALAHARRFFSSLGHYGKTPYIYPLYGAGEVPQVCARTCIYVSSPAFFVFVFFVFAFFLSLFFSMILCKHSLRLAALWSVLKTAHSRVCVFRRRQAFCRLCAVFGGTYMLRQRIGGFVTARDDDKRCCGVTIGGEVFDANWVVTTSACLPNTYPGPGVGSRAVRAVVVTDGTRHAVHVAHSQF